MCRTEVETVHLWNMVKHGTSGCRRTEHLQQNLEIHSLLKQLHQCGPRRDCHWVVATTCNLLNSSCDCGSLILCCSTFPSRSSVSLQSFDLLVFPWILKRTQWLYARMLLPPKIGIGATWFKLVREEVQRSFIMGPIAHDGGNNMKQPTWYLLPGILIHYHIVLYCILLSIVLYCILLYCTVSYRIVLYLFLIDEIIQWGNYEEICKGQLRSSGRTLLVRKLVCRPERSFCSSIVVCQRQVLWLPSALELYISSLQGDHLVLFIFISF